MRILFVEDHPGFRAQAIRHFLSGHQVTVASTLAEARMLLASDRFDAVLLDHDLPDGCGTDLLEAVAHSSVPAPVIAISSRDDNNDRLLAAGAFAAVSKMRFDGITNILAQLEGKSGT